MRLTFGALAVAAGLGLFCPALGKAQCPPDAVGCHTEDAISWTYRDAAFDDIMLDSGWVPSGGPIQLRFTFFVGGSTQVDMTGDLVCSWPEPLSTEVTGVPMTGRLAINYGIELRIQLRFDVTIAGIRYNWEGDIPVPGIPEDLRMAAEGMFDPFLMPPSDRPFSVMDMTDRVAVLRYDALGSFISIPGVSGGIALTLQGVLETSYETERIVMSDALDIAIENGSTVVGPDPGATMGYGAAKHLLVHPVGTLTHDGDLIVSPILYLSFAGTRREYPLVEIPIPFVRADDEAVFPDAELDIPLPDILVTPTNVEVGEVHIGETGSRRVEIVNGGMAELEVYVSDPMAPFATSSPSLTLPPRSTGWLDVLYAPAKLGADATIITLHTNDPDTPTVELAVTAWGLEPLPTPDGGPPPDPDGGPMITPDASVVPVGPPEEGGCGCRVAGEPRTEPLFYISFVLGLALLTRRRILTRWTRRNERSRASGRSQRA